MQSVAALSRLKTFVTSLVILLVVAPMTVIVSINHQIIVANTAKLHQIDAENWTEKDQNKWSQELQRLNPTLAVPATLRDKP